MSVLSMIVIFIINASEALGLQKKLMYDIYIGAWLLLTTFFIILILLVPWTAVLRTLIGLADVSEIQYYQLN